MYNSLCKDWKEGTLFKIIEVMYIYYTSDTKYYRQPISVLIRATHFSSICSYALLHELLALLQSISIRK